MTSDPNKDKISHTAEVKDDGVCVMGTPKDIIQYITSVEEIATNTSVKYKITTTRGEMVIKDGDILKPSVWKTQALTGCKILISSFPDNEITELVHHVINNAVKPTSEEDKPSGENGKRNTFAVTAAMQAFSDHLQQAEAMQQITPILYDTAKTYWIWSETEKCYVQSDTTDILNGIKNDLGDRMVITMKVKTEVLEAIRMTGRERWNKTLPVPETWVQFKNCVYDLETGETHGATNKYFYTKPIPHNLGDSDDTPTVDRLLGEWVGDDYKQMMYEILGYAFYNGYPIHRVFAFFGSGRNGKGQFMGLMKNLVGTYNICSTSLERLSDSRFEAAYLRDRLVAFITETNFSQFDKTAQLKALCGGDDQQAEYKGGAKIDFVNTAKIVISTNSLPETNDKTRGFYARWIIIDFPNEFKGGKPVINEVPETEYENLCMKCIGHLRELLERGEFDKEGSIDDRAAKYEATSDPMSTFIRDLCEERWDATEPTFNFVRHFKAWCVSKNFRAGKEKDIRTHVNGRFQTESKHEWVVNGERKQWQTLLGIRIRNSEFSKPLSGDGSVNHVNEVNELSLSSHTRGNEVEPRSHGSHGSQQQSKHVDISDESIDIITHAFKKLTVKNPNLDGWSVLEITGSCNGRLSSDAVGSILAQHTDALGAVRTNAGYKLAE